MVGNNNSVFEIGIMARVTWDLHSLNNEGNVGNVTEPRTVVLASGEKSDGISGEMLKHIHSYNIWLSEADKSSFCPACAHLQPQRADLPDYRKTLKGNSNTEIMDIAIANCVLCDLHGFLVQEPPINRRSTIEFGWVVGLPDQQYRDIHLHARHSMEERRARGKSNENKMAEGEQESEVSAQMIYHRPTRSGVYALVSLFQPWRIGLNEINYEYIKKIDKQYRYTLALKAYKAIFMHTDGAMTSTRLPHLEGIEGVIVISNSNCPVPLISPLKKNYREELKNVSQNQNYIELQEFNNLNDVLSILDRIMSRPIFSFKR